LEPQRIEIHGVVKSSKHEEIWILKETGDTQGQDDAVMRQFPTRLIPHGGGVPAHAA
jgi:hypothetical protein